MDTTIRRTIALAGDRKEDLDMIKRQTGFKTDTGAIDYAVRFGATFAGRDISDVKNALQFWDEVKRQIGNGFNVMLENPRDNSHKIQMWIPRP